MRLKKIPFIWLFVATCMTFGTASASDDRYTIERQIDILDDALLSAEFKSIAQLVGLIHDAYGEYTYLSVDLRTSDAGRRVHRAYYDASQVAKDTSVGDVEAKELIVEYLQTAKTNLFSLLDSIQDSEPIPEPEPDPIPEPEPEPEDEGEEIIRWYGNCECVARRFAGHPRVYADYKTHPAGSYTFCPSCSPKHYWQNDSEKDRRYKNDGLRYSAQEMVQLCLDYARTQSACR